MIKKDVEELTKIVIENKISKVRIHDVFFQIKASFVNPWSRVEVLEEAKACSDEQIAVSEIIGHDTDALNNDPKLLIDNAMLSN